MYVLNDKWLRLIGVPLVAVMSNFIFYDPENSLHNISRFKALSLSLAECIILWEVSRQVIIKSRKRYPQLNQTKARILFQVVGLIFSTIVMRVGINYLYDVTLFWGYPMSARSYWVNTLIPFLFTVPVFAIYEGRYLYRQWWTTYFEVEQLKKENLQSQLESLKSQINPHFLFNSLSTLSSLVSEDQKRAEWFIDELASVYRYLLQTNEQSLTTLEQELQFILAYFNLLKTRFGEGIELELEIDERLHSYLLPPLTLQLLIENAVKHNVTSPAQPLLIRIYTDEANNLYVLNSLRKKQIVVPSNRTGLNNISKKYKLLNQPDVVIRQTDELFQVMIPLIKVKAYENLPY